MKRVWITWWVTTILLGSYVMLGFLASHSSSTQIKLQPGASAKLLLVRLLEHDLRMQLEFRGDHRNRPELGDPGQTGDSYRTGLLEYPQPGAAIRVAASSAGTEPVLFEALPNSGWGANFVLRTLTGNLSIRPGVWRWPDPAESPRVVLHPGFNLVNVEIVSVEPPLVGENARVLVQPLLDFKACMPGVCWLWGSLLLWPVMLFVQVLWAVTLNAVSARKAPQNTMIFM